MSATSYENWSREELIKRLEQLDASLATRKSSPRVKSTPRGTFDFSSYSRRKIALKFCYSGWEYNGLAFQNDKTPLPTVEGTLYNALASCKLIDADAGPEGCGWERCGRTDRGVSSAGQVVSLWVRSNIGRSEIHPVPSFRDPQPTKDPRAAEDAIADEPSDFSNDLHLLSIADDEDNDTLPLQSGAKEELHYISILNRVLPPTIRILAWAPVSPSFSSRFDCQYRHYKYFFSPAGLNLDAMRDAALRLVGTHDFRNLCKIDPSKQITSFKRKILSADISSTSVFIDPSQPTSNRPELGDSGPYMCVFDLIGTAFLYNQVRHIVAVLFLVGCGLEHPSVITSLLNVEPENPLAAYREGEPTPDLVECKPEYQMADPLPLMLWECAYSKDDVNWQLDGRKKPPIYDEDYSPLTSTHTRVTGLYRDMQAVHARSLIQTALHAQFLRAAAVYHSPPADPFPLTRSGADIWLNTSSVLSIPIGGGLTRRTAATSYVPLLKRKRLEHVDIVNERWRLGKGSRRAEKKAVFGAVLDDDE